MIIINIKLDIFERDLLVVVVLVVTQLSFIITNIQISYIFGLKFIRCFYY